MPALSSNQRVRIALLESERLTRDQLCAATGLSRPTVQRALTAMTESGEVIQLGGSEASGAGRPPVFFALAPGSGLLVGVDIGRGHVRVAVSDWSGAIVAGPEFEPCDLASEGLGVLGTVARLIRELIGDDDPRAIRAVGVGLPAPVFNDRVASSGYLQYWENQDVPRILGDLIAATRDGQSVPSIRLVNDANLGALGEGRRGQVAFGARNYAYVKVSNGIGAGLVLNGALYSGSFGAAAEWGHVVTSVTPQNAVPQQAAVEARASCAQCGRRDCLENLAACPAIVFEVRQLLLMNDHARDPLHDPRLSVEEAIDQVISRARTQQRPDVDRFCLAGISNAAQRIGHTLTDLIRLLDPEVVVIGGLLAQARDLIESPIQHIVARASLPPNAVHVEVVEPDRIWRSEIDGAIAVAMDESRRELDGAAR